MCSMITTKADRKLVALGDGSSHQIISIYVHDDMVTCVADNE
jgi:hypothetical protein